MSLLYGRSLCSGCRIRSSWNASLGSFCVPSLISQRREKNVRVPYREHNRHSNLWLHKHLTDRYVNLARENMYRSRAAYKLKQIDDKFMFLRKNTVVLDLGCFPGGWSQVAVERCYPGSSRSVVIGVDRTRPDPVQSQTFIQGTVGEEETLTKVLHELGAKRADVVLSDMAPNMIGVRMDDHLSSMEVALRAAEFMEETLKIGGWFVVKFISGGQTDNLKIYLSTIFKKVHSVKPKASRDESGEMFLVGQHFTGRPRIAEEVKVKGSFNHKEGWMTPPLDRPPRARPPRVEAFKQSEAKKNQYDNNEDDK
eukprot:GDKH01019688.1.p1 GENE.GDKH01019688.1~~GDKH01019688.1.p1  ORF type:complete len:310 (+),score=33.49 GDKH01019688.1:124-1053(+)